MASINSETIETWFTEIKQGYLVLPRFQRHPAWKDDQVASLFENILRKPALPIGVLLVLDVGDKQPFISRPIDGAPPAADSPNMHLLDGQQRMTAIWKALNDEHDRARFFVDLSPPEEDMPDADAPEPRPQVATVKRVRIRTDGGVQTPKWTTDPAETASRDLIPLAILRPGHEGEAAAKSWVKAASESMDRVIFLNDQVATLRARVASFQIPFLKLDKSTSQGTALDVFINMNTSATPLKAFDIVVAQHEGATGESLHDRVAALREDVPALKRFDKIEDLILSVSALIMGRAPIKQTYLEPGFAPKLETHWPRIVNGFRRGMAFLEQEGVFGTAFVPNDTAMQLVLALWGDLPEGKGSVEGNARDLIRNVFWRGCLTDRYGKTSATRSFADYPHLHAAIHRGDDPGQASLFDSEQFPLANAEEFIRAGWPKRKDRLPRSVLALSMRRDALDFAHAAKASPDTVGKRELHHLYPVKFLKVERSDAYANRALNCALIDWKTNRTIGANAPEAYINAEAEAASLGEDAVRQRLESHLIPYDALIAGDYDAFLKARADRVLEEVGKILTIQG